MWISNEGYYAKFKYVEIARYLNIDGVELIARYMKDKKKKEPLLIDVKDIQHYCDINNNVGIYTSVFQYNDDHFNESPLCLGSLYFDLDSEKIESALCDTRLLVEYLNDYMVEDAIRIYFTGKKGFHVECEAVALGVSPSEELASIYRFIASNIKDKLGLQSIDFAVYEPRRMWRYPNSQHQYTKLYKIPISQKELFSYTGQKIGACAAMPRPIEVPDQVFDINANAWYREFTYEYEQFKQPKTITAQSVIERFNQHGTSAVHDYVKEFDPIKLFEGCPAILELWQKAEKTHDLEHEERLFLCSILSYTDEAIEYLHAILSNCSDYKFEKTQGHIEDWMRRRELGIGGRPFSCDRAREAGIVCEGCEKLAPRQKYEQIGDKLYPTNELSQPSPVRLAYSRKEND